MRDALAPRPRLKHRRNNGPAPSLGGPKTVADSDAHTQHEDEGVEDNDAHPTYEDEVVADVEIVLDENDNIQLVPPVCGS